MLTKKISNKPKSAIAISPKKEKEEYWFYVEKKGIYVVVWYPQNNKTRSVISFLIPWNKIIKFNTIN